MAVTGISTTVKKVITDLGMEEMSARLAEFHQGLEIQRDNLTLYTGEYRRAKDECEDIKLEVLRKVSHDNEGKAESFIERQHKVELSSNDRYSVALIEAREARDSMDATENKIKVYEAEIRSIQVQMGALSSALMAAAAQTRAKTTAAVMGNQAQILAAANL